MFSEDSGQAPSGSDTYTVIIEAWYLGSSYSSGIVGEFPIAITITVNPCLYASFTFGTIITSPIEKDYDSATEVY